MHVTALIPAHNEAHGIGATIDALRGQTRPPDQIVVVADNCTDDTAAVAAAHGATVHHTVGNTGKKAGALNQGLALILPDLDGDDLIVVADADGALAPTWIAAAATRLDDHRLGAVCAQVHCDAIGGHSPLALLQRAEYAQGARRVSRRAGRVWVLSGAAVAYRADVARHLIAVRGYVYDESSLTEDYEMTLALWSLGYDTRGYKELVVHTDVMLTWRDLFRQRLRWQRGTIETLWAYGWSPVTRRPWAAQAGVYAASLLLPTMAAIWVWIAHTGVDPDLRWLAVLPVFSLDQFVSARKAGLAAAVLSATLLPTLVYGAFVLATGWIALAHAALRSESAWA